ncbi:hypothetical protein FB45DRAFT_889933 [Roridomyces roridus]|uniref:Protein kinase domain-containing protein n=1 Tax=Roridomyces roridus TaxID=1738132 RepID=A0AAD7G396_9AGAR|nr:hypothetical protein FB45DRAFT_889933 [Roridomyces roridus]
MRSSVYSSLRSQGSPAFSGLSGLTLKCSKIMLASIIVLLLRFAVGYSIITWTGTFALYQWILFATEGWLVGYKEFRDFMMGDMILTCLGYLAFGRPETTQPRRTRLWDRLKRLLKRSRAGAIALPLDDSEAQPIELEDTPLAEPDPVQPPADDSWSPPAGFEENLSRWLALESGEFLWITVEDPRSIHRLACAANSIFEGEKRLWAGLVDVSRAQTVGWALVHGLASASLDFRRTVGYTLPQVISQLFAWFPIHRRFYLVPPMLESSSTWYREPKDLLNDCIGKPFERRYDDQGVLMKLKMFGTVLVVHGIKNKEQAAQMWEIIHILQRQLKEEYSWVLRIVIITEPRLFRRVVKKQTLNLGSLPIMHIVEPGLLLYSETRGTLRPPHLSENVFKLMVEGVYRMGGLDAERTWPELTQISKNRTRKNTDPADRTALDIFFYWYKVSQDRRHIQKIISLIPSIAPSRFSQALARDNTKVAETLQELFLLDNYREALEVVPREHSKGVLNLIHSVLDNGFSKGFEENSQVFEAFLKQTHRILNALVGHLGHLPDGFDISNVSLRSDHPVNRGGFAIIYRGFYPDPVGTAPVEVALKVLPIFGHHSEEEKRRTWDKFTREALVWRYLKHPNVVPFLGIDSATFDSPQRALVSPWMAQGSVLDFLAKNSPAGSYALDLCRNIIDGLEYLHSRNVIHGDLCGRNILIGQNGRACLSDFGLAAFVEADTTSSHSGSRQWMSPELLNQPPGMRFRRTVASDVWAFACVCCEIWTEGTVPFSRMEMISDGQTLQNPYPDKPADKAGVEMPDTLWEICQWCWNSEAAERPALLVINDMLSSMNQNTTGLPLAPSRENRTSSPQQRSPSNPSAQTVLVRFGPVPSLDLSNPEETFRTEIFDNLMEHAQLPQSALVEPLLVYTSVDEPDSLDLHFRSAVEANGFAMTWRMRRFEPYLECSAEIVEGY